MSRTRIALHCIALHRIALRLLSSLWHLLDHLVAVGWLCSVCFASCITLHLSLLGKGLVLVL